MFNKHVPPFAKSSETTHRKVARVFHNTLIMAFFPVYVILQSYTSMDDVFIVDNSEASEDGGTLRLNNVHK